MTVLLSKGLPRRVSEVQPGFQRWGSPGTNGMMYDRFKTMAYEEIYRNQPAVFSVVNRLLEGICRIPIKVYEFGPDGDSRSRVRSNKGATANDLRLSQVIALANLLTEPWAGHSQWELKERLGFDLLTHGKCLGWKLRPETGALPVELWPIPWWCVVPIWDMRGFQAFQIYLDGTLYLLAPEDVVYIELAGRGTSPLEPLRRSIGIEDRAMDWQDEALATGFSAKAVFTTKISLRDGDTVQATREQLDQLYTGPSGKQYAVLGEGSDIKTLSGLSAVDIGLITARQFSREDVCSAYAVNPYVMGFSSVDKKASTYASAVEQRRSFVVDAIGPKLTLLEELLKTQLVRSESAWQNAFVEFDMSELMRPDPESLARAELMSQQSSTTATNERRRDFRNLEPVAAPGFAVDDPSNPYNLPWQPVNMMVPGAQPPALAIADGNAAAAEMARLVVELMRAPAVQITEDDEEDED